MIGRSLTRALVRIAFVRSEPASPAVFDDASSDCSAEPKGL